MKAKYNRGLIVFVCWNSHLACCGYLRNALSFLRRWNTVSLKTKIKMNSCKITTFFFFSTDCKHLNHVLSEWLAEEKAQWQKREEMEVEWIWHDEFQCPHWSAALTSLTHPCELGLEQAGSWRSWRAVTALSNHITRHSVWGAPRLPHMMDRWQSFLLFCFT